MSTKGHIKCIRSCEVEKAACVFFWRGHKKIKAPRLSIRKSHNCHALLYADCETIFQISCCLQCSNILLELLLGLIQTKKHINITRCYCLAPERADNIPTTLCR
jgi:hypothetical protein